MVRSKSNLMCAPRVMQTLNHFYEESAMKWITLKFVVAVFAVLFAAAASAAEDSVPTIQQAPAPQAGTVVVGDDVVDCFFEANAGHALCQKPRADVAIKLEPKVTPPQTAAGADE
jgi:hypothetical protein